MEQQIFKYAIDSVSQHIIVYVPFETFIGRNSAFTKISVTIASEYIEMIAEQIQNVLLEDNETGPKTSN